MTPSSERPDVPIPDVGALAQSMLLVHGGHDDHDDHAPREPTSGSWSKSAVTGATHAEALREATQRDRERYLNAGLQPVDCRFCHVAVRVKKLGPEFTSVQWTKEATQRCAFFSEQRGAGGPATPIRACPKLADSISHAIAEGILEAVSSAPSPGDG